MLVCVCVLVREWFTYTIGMQRVSLLCTQTERERERVSSVVSFQISIRDGTKKLLGKTRDE